MAVNNSLNREIINDDSMATASATTLSTSLSIKNYVDAVAEGLEVKDSCFAASTAALTVTYDNGTSGVGATLTNAGTQATFALDGLNPGVGNRVLIKNQASTFQNGIYEVTDVGSGATNWVLTRTEDFDEASEIAPGVWVPIDTGGTSNGGTSWLETATVTTIGTDPITFIQFTVNPDDLCTLSTNQSITGVKTIVDSTSLFFGTSNDASIQYNGTDLLINPQAVGLGDVVLSAGDLRLGDSQSVVLGTGEDATILFDGTNLVINPDAVGSGVVEIDGNVGLGTSGRQYTRLDMLLDTDTTSGVTHYLAYGDLSNSIGTGGGGPIIYVMYADYNQNTANHKVRGYHLEHATTGTGNAGLHSAFTATSSSPAGSYDRTINDLSVTYTSNPGTSTDITGSNVLLDFTSVSDTANFNQKIYGGIFEIGVASEWNTGGSGSQSLFYALRTRCDIDAANTDAGCQVRSISVENPTSHADHYGVYQVSSTVRNYFGGVVYFNNGLSFDAGTNVLDQYEEGTFTPVFDFATTGDLSVVYTAQLGNYTRIGNVVYISVNLAFTPTFTTSAGNCQITGLPFTVSSGIERCGGPFWNSLGITYTSGRTFLNCYYNPGATYAFLNESGTGVQTSKLTPSNFTTATSTQINFNGFYFI